MNVTLTFLSFSGSPAEFASVERFFEARSGAGHIINVKNGDDIEADGAKARNEHQAPVENGVEGPSEAAFIAVIQRVPLSDEYRSYIRVIYDAGDQGTTIPEIANKTGQPEKRVKSAFRNFGKRVAHTTEWPKGEGFLKSQWLSTQNRYWLHSAMRDAIDGGRISL